LPSGPETLAFYPDHYHLAMRDLNRETVIGDVVGWMKNPRAPLESGADHAAEDWVKTAR
jgi:hypothetical protein